MSLIRPVQFAVFVAIIFAALLASTGTTSAADGEGAVFTTTNSPEGNEVVMFRRLKGGELVRAGTFPTGGLGTGAGLESQGAVILSYDGNTLFSVNAGSDDISVFSVNDGGLTLQSRVASGGDHPSSLTMHGHVVYVLNAGGDGNITGFTFANGALTPIPDSTRPLSAVGVAPAEVEFSPNGRVLAVTERGTHRITTYTVQNGIPSAPIVHDSNGQVPFGFAFNSAGYMIVSEAGSRAVSSYDVANDGSVSVITPSAETGQVAACWVVVSKDGRFAYTANAGSSSISGYSIDGQGRLTLLTEGGVTGYTGDGSGPIDMTLSGNGKHLYALSARNGTIAIFSVGNDGALTALPVAADALLVGASGLAGY